MIDFWQSSWLYLCLSIGIGFLSLYVFPRTIKTANAAAKYKYALTYVPGLFQHDGQRTGPSFRAKTLPDLGLIDQSYESDSTLGPQAKDAPWNRFRHHIKQLNDVNPSVQFKVFYVARHGEGLHNTKEREVGRREYERYWSKLDGDESMTWRDAHLTAKGFEQAKDLARFWHDAIAADTIPAPQRYYTSPLARSLQTVQATFSKVDNLPTNSFKPIVKEALRERYGVYTCDRRSSRTWITTTFPTFTIEPSFSEDDELWKSTIRERSHELKARLAEFLVDVFRYDEATYISLTLHSWAIRGLYQAVGHPEIWPYAGHITPLVVRAERQS